MAAKSWASLGGVWEGSPMDVAWRGLASNQAAGFPGVCITMGERETSSVLVHVETSERRKAGRREWLSPFVGGR